MLQNTFANVLLHQRKKSNQELICAHTNIICNNLYAFWSKFIFTKQIQWWKCWLWYGFEQVQTIETPFTLSRHLTNPPSKKVNMHHWWYSLVFRTYCYCISTKTGKVFRYNQNIKICCFSPLQKKAKTQFQNSLLSESGSLSPPSQLSQERAWQYQGCKICPFKSYFLSVHQAKFESKIMLSW